MTLHQTWCKVKKGMLLFCIEFYSEKYTLTLNPCRCDNHHQFKRCWLWDFLDLLHDACFTNRSQFLRLMPTVINGSYFPKFVNRFYVLFSNTGGSAQPWAQLLWWQNWSKSLVEEGRLKVRKFGVYVWDGPHFFQAFKRKIAVCQCLLAGIPLG